MSHINKMKQFGKVRWYPKPKTDKQWDILYKNHKTVIPSVKSISLEWSKKGQGQTGARYFKYYNIPPLKYWNKSLDVQTKKNVEEIKSPKLVCTLNDGTVQEIELASLTNTEILEKLVSIDPEGKIITNGPGHLISLD
eukprot:TRINITY_DN8665_c0_g1_i1.p1 TRINITY_DN8665_c0_g1~~TRINITY_DN8665_c0_g1_i1.p1  ORF type:complete len:148 (-),score=32.94 TRINITY_DN8665_c0_g1_i1:123-536(-)